MLEESPLGPKEEAAEDLLILVDEKDTPIGQCPKQEAHEKNLLHRAFSIFLFNEQGETLVQQRALHKYHSGGLWANSCCSHPRVGESLEAACQRRLAQELGLIVPNLTKLFHTVYQVDLDKGVSEHEFVHVYKAFIPKSTPVSFNPEEVHAVKWLSPEALIQDVEDNPKSYAYWLRTYLTSFEKALFDEESKAA